MAHTVFANGVTLTDAAWFQDVDTVTYTYFGNGTNLTGTFTPAANIALGANFISRAGTSAGLSVDASNNFSMSAALTVGPANGSAKLDVGSTGLTQVNYGLIDVGGQTGGMVKFAINTTVSGSIYGNAGGMALDTLAAQPIAFFTNSVQQASILHTAGATRYITFTGSNGGNPQISTSGGNISLGVSLTMPANGTITLSGASGQVIASASASQGYAFNTDTTTGIGWVGAGVFAAYTSGAERWRTTAQGYFKASNSGTYQSATSSEHEMYTDNNGGAHALKLTNAAATATNQYGQATILSGDPNDATRYFLTCVGTVTTRAQIRSNGGFANFQANDVNLCDPRAKVGMKPLESQWDFFKNLPTYSGSYADDPELRRHAMISADDVEGLEPSIIEPWSEEFKGVREHDIQVRSWNVIRELIHEVESLRAQLH